MTTQTTISTSRLVIIPTYNEIENIERMLEKVLSLSPEFDILIVDDGSPDGTASIVKQKIEQLPKRIHLIERSGKLGLGTAYIAGFEWALKNNYDHIFEMDCDFSHNPDDLIRLDAQLLEGSDLAVGSRYVRGGKLKNWPLSRILISFGASVYVRLITFMPVKDPTAGFVAYKKEVLSAIDFKKIKFIGYAFQIEMKFATYLLGFKIKEIPILFSDREEGVSKMSGGIVREAVMGVLQMRFWAFSNSYSR
ncbi:MAG: polyprenol monophosphomannose synthase [Saprospiraceae bacterium]|nr:polyprenol monophosphomannose synthase [Saprospiraceae bacterium]